MKKKKLKFLAVGFALVGILTAVSACAEEQREHDMVEDPTMAYVCGWNERCSGADGYFEINALTVSAADGEYYAIVEYETNLADSVISDAENRAELLLSPSENFNLEFYRWDFGEYKLTFKLPQDSLSRENCEKLCRTEISRENTFPTINIFLKYFDTYCQVDGQNYVGKYFALPMKYV